MNAAKGGKNPISALSMLFGGAALVEEVKAKEAAGLKPSRGRKKPVSIWSVSSGE